MKRKIIVALALAGTIGIGTAYAAGLWPDMPVVGGATYCAGTSATATGTIIGAITGCPNQVPAGPTIMTGLEQIPADTRAAGGAAPQSVLVPMASLNALPITVVTTGLTPYVATNGTIKAAATSGGIILVPTVALTGTTNITLPASPIDGQQFLLTSAFGLTTLVVTSANAIDLVNLATTALTTSATASFGYRYLYNVAAKSWYRLQ